MPRLDRVETFFEATTSPYRIGLVRIPIGMVCLLDALVTWRDLGILFQSDALRVPHFSWLPTLQASQSDLFVAVWLTSSVCFIVGLFSRTAGVVLVVCFAYRLALDQTLYTTNIYLCGLLVLLLVIGNAGAAVSLDRRRRGGHPSNVLRWPETLLKLQISLVYLFTAIEKVNPGVFSGDSYQKFMPEVLWGYTFLHKPIPAAIIVFEIVLAFALWSRRTRGWAFFLGLAFHTAILFKVGFLAGLMAYSTMFVGSYFLFVDEGAGSRHLVGPPGLLKWLRRLDWLRIHHYEPASGSLSLDGASHRLTGWPALRATLNVLPVTCLWAAVFDLPLVRNLGQMVYKRLVTKIEASPYPSASP